MQGLMDQDGCLNEDTGVRKHAHALDRLLMRRL